MLNGNKTRATNPLVTLLREAKKSVATGRKKKAERKAANQNLMREVYRELA